MNLEDALRVAALLEADDVISPVAMACRKLAVAIRDLETQIVDLNLEVLSLSLEVLSPQVNNPSE